MSRIIGLRRDFPGLATCCALHPVQKTCETPLFIRIAQLFRRSGRLSNIGTAFLCCSAVPARRCYSIEI